MIITTAQKNILTVCLLLFTPALYAQDDEAQIRQSIGIFFEGFAKSDTNLVASVSDRNMGLQTVIERKDGTVMIRSESRKHLMEVIAQPRKEKFEERIVNWDIRTDGAYANAWCTYELYLDSVMHHWGIDNFQLVKEAGKWRILSITDTRHRTDRSEMVKQEEENLRKEIDEVLNNWHRAAANADEKMFFGSIDSAGIYLGTDKTERWTKQEFEQWSKKYFDLDKAWDFTPRDRHIYFSEQKNYAWFDELLDTWMGVCRGSGVLRCENDRWKIMHYNLAVTIPNEKIEQFIRINK